MPAHPVAAGTWVALPADMQPSYPSEQAPGLEGPDYVALVIEWNDDEEDAPSVPEPTYPRGTLRTIAAVVGALGALLFAAWGIRRLRSA
jgi:hypothetical protein